MSIQNNSTLPKIWLVIEIAHHIAQFSRINDKIALACTCKVLYAFIITRNSFWRKLYRQHFPHDINTDIDWLQWQLKQEPMIAEAATDVEHKTISGSTWLRLYRQRINMGINWQKNRPTSTVHIKSNMVDELLRSGNGHNMIIATYPGWIAIANRDNLSVSLIKLLTRNTTKIYPLNLDKHRFNTIKNITFYQYRQQVDGSDEGIRVAICLSYFESFFGVLQIWNPNNCQLLHSIDVDGSWDGRIIGASLVLPSSQVINPYSNSQSPCNTRLVYNIGSTAQSCGLQSIILSHAGDSYKYKIHMTNNKEAILVRYCTSKYKLDYQIVRVPLTPSTDLAVIGDNMAQMTTIVSDHIRLFNNTKHWASEIHSIDSDRILVHCSTSQLEETPNGMVDSNQCYIQVISLSKGIILDFNHPVKFMQHSILIPAYNLAVFYPCGKSSLAVMSLLNGEILRDIYLKKPLTRLLSFQHLVDTKIVSHDHNTGQYCIIDVLTGDVDIYKFPVSEMQHYRFTFGHMLLTDNEYSAYCKFLYLNWIKFIT